MKLEFCAPCLFGLEGPLGNELRHMGLEDVRGEDGRVYYEGGEFRLEPEEVYTISDYFVMNGKDIDTMFEENFGEDYESLEELMAHNAERGEG